jgi:hypothetical protein
MNLNPSEISDLIKSRIQNMQLAASARESHAIGNGECARGNRGGVLASRMPSNENWLIECGARSSGAFSQAEVCGAYATAACGLFAATHEGASLDAAMVRPEHDEVSRFLILPHSLLSIDNSQRAFTAIQLPM